MASVPNPLGPPDSPVVPPPPPPASDVLDLSGKGLPYALICRALEEHTLKSSGGGALPRTLILKQNLLSTDGSEALAREWLRPPPPKEGGDEEDGSNNNNNSTIESLNCASCSVGRFCDPDTGAYKLSDDGCASIGAQGSRLVHLNLGWNDLSSTAVEALVRGLLAIEGPAFDADSFNPAQLAVGRNCAMVSLDLEGNSIGDDGASWLTFLLKHGGRLEKLGLRQCALEEFGAESLAKRITADSNNQHHQDHDDDGKKNKAPSSSRLTHLDLRDNDLGEGSGEIARAAADLLVDLNGGQIIFDDLHRRLSTSSTSNHRSSSSTSSTTSRHRDDDPNATTTTTTTNDDDDDDESTKNVVLAPGPESMCHGVLAVLFALRRSIELSRLLPPAPPSPSSISGNGDSDGGGGTTVSVTIDLRGTQACGYYQERTEVVDELLSLLSAQSSSTSTSTSTSSGGGSDEASSSSTSESAVVIANPEDGEAVGATATAPTSAAASSRVRITKVLLDDESGLTERQVQRLHDTASRDHDNAAAIVLNGAAFEPTGWSCVLQ